MKYIIEFEDEYSMNEGGMKYYQCKQLPYWSVSNGIIKNLTPYTESDRKVIEDEVWEFVRIITDMTEAQRKECFGGATCDLDDYLTYQEAKAKYEAWKKKDVIHVGDEVNPINDTWRGVVVNVDNEDLTIMGSSGISVNGYESKYFSKTGRHFDEVADLLEKIRGEE